MPSTADPRGERPGSTRPVDAVAHVVDAVDRLVPEADDPGSDLPVTSSRSLPWVGILFALCAVALVPWIFYLLDALPSRALSPNFDIAWAGFDVMLLVALLATAVATLRRSRWMSATGGWTAGLLVTDAWFDLVTAPDQGALIEAILLAVLVELPLAGISVWVCLHAQEIVERRILLLQRRARGAGGRPGGRPRVRLPRRPR
ncbi:hypothetical protein [Arsenicicoccus dermatophilus]|uniref:hypothetical protein n=1 Tax=Arsenicicoccus dermatophilus TaxID=1076331 RepID=UPI001F4CB99C|nr:hypothetical protein [Arsenicicoccus dermatophilus]MCH8614338.1 hypothetical protein [Arsenicicoccus dermatophilus]